MPEWQYVDWMHHCVDMFCENAPVVWVSFNSRWLLQFARVFRDIAYVHNYEFKPCVQTFTFYQHNSKGLGNAHRPLWRLKHPEAPEYPEQIKVPSWRQQNGDKRAKAGGKVPGDVFDFPRVTGNSKQRRSWHPTQLHEGLVERCIKLNTLEDAWVTDPFAGTGTTLRVCKRINRNCILIDSDKNYIERLREEHENPSDS